MKRRARYSVYVVELSPEVLQRGRFRRANPGYDATKPCVYVGMTGLDPDVRFEPQLYEIYNPMPYDGARDMEVELAIALREKGYGVWQG